MQERVPQPPGEQPVGEDLVADYHTGTGKVLVGRDPERLARGGHVLHLYARALRNHGGLSAGVRREAHEEQPGDGRELVNYPRDATVQYFLAAVPVGDERFYVEDDRPCGQGRNTVVQALLAEFFVSGTHGISQLTGLPAVAARLILSLVASPSSVRIKIAESGYCPLPGVQMFMAFAAQVRSL